MRSKPLYLRSLYRRNKLLFWGVILFFTLHINANFFFGDQQSPFIYWNLYPSPIPEQETYSFYEVQCDGEVISSQHTWQEPGVLLIRNPVDFFMFMKKNSRSPLADYIDRWNDNHPLMAALTPGIQFYPDTADMNRFPGWLTAKMEHMLRRQIEHIDIYKTTVIYNKDGSVTRISREKVCKIR